MTVSGWVRLTTIATGITLALTFGSLPTVSASHDDDDQGDRDRIEGSWAIDIVNPFNLPLRILRTITNGGVVDAYAFPPITATQGPLINSGGHGNWKKIGPRTYAVTVIYFQLDPRRNNDFPPLILDTVGKVRETIKLSKDAQSYTSNFLTDITFPNGSPATTNAGSTTAKRINVEPL